MMNILSTCNHKALGIYYIIVSVFFSLAGTLFSLVIRNELYSVGSRVVASENLNMYNIVITLHAFVMIFYFVMPAMFGGFGNYYLPVDIGSVEIAFPRVNLLALVLLVASYVVLMYSITGEWTGGSGWTMYAPLACSCYTNYVIYGLLLAGVGSLLGSVNLFTTMICMKTAGLTLNYCSPFVWSISLTALLLLLSLPVLTGALILLVLDTSYNTCFFDAALGGDPVLYQHLFWFFGHPEVYIIVLPAFGLVSNAVAYFSQNVLFGVQSMILAMACIGILGSVVWGHHMYTVAMDADTKAYFTATTMCISLPTATKIFNWLAGMAFNNVGYNGPLVLTSVVFVVMFVLGGVTGVVLANGGVDIALHDTYYVVAHFHYVLSLGAVIGFLVGLIHGLDYLAGMSFVNALSSQTLGLVIVSVVLVGVVTTFTTMHAFGFNVLPRRIPDYPVGLIAWNNILSVGSGVTVFALCLLTL